MDYRIILIAFATTHRRTLHKIRQQGKGLWIYSKLEIVQSSLRVNDIKH